jgi:hypothetical protein
MKPIPSSLELNSPSPAQAETPSTRPQPTRPGLVTTLSLLLLVQAAGLVVIDLFFFVGLEFQTGLVWPGVLAQSVAALTIEGIFIVLALLAGLAAIGLLRLRRSAWLMAMLLQGLCLLTALSLYFQQDSPYVYIIMLYSIVMVIMLNYSEVYLVFQPVTGFGEPEDE